MPRGFTCAEVAYAALGEPLKRSGPELFYRAPWREDQHPSLQINTRKNTWADFPAALSGNAWALAARLAACDPSDKPTVTAWLKARGLLNDGAKRTTKTGGRGPCVATHTYTDADGKPVARKLRFEPGTDGRKKDFVWERLENGKWVAGLDAVKVPLYRLPETRNSDWVVITEGEKDADAGAGIGLPATTSGGVNTWREDHSENLRGKNVVIVADADEPGRIHAQKVAASLRGKAASLKLVEIPGSKDLAEAIEKGATVEALALLFDEAPEWKPATGAEILDSAMGSIRQFVSVSESQARAVTLWTAHTHAFDAADCTPYLAVNSPEKQSGKTRLLEVLRLLVFGAWFTGRITAATLTRKIDKEHPSCCLTNQTPRSKESQLTPRLCAAF